MKAARLTKHGIFVRPGVKTSSLNVYLDGRHLWTVSADAAVRKAGVLVSWPDELLRAMDGYGLFDVRDSDGEILDKRSITFGSSERAIDLRDADGRLLTVNKWGTLTNSFEQQSREDKDRLIARTAEVLEQLRELGLDAFIVGGTLLGAVRNGDVLEHDDDADTAYLSKYAHPADVALESFEIQRALERKGYWIVRHSVSHLQVMFTADSGHIDHFVDVFTALFKDGRFYEPIHVDTDELAQEDIVPTTTVTLRGTELEAPANVEGWLAACYGKNWRTPDPTFTFETPEATVRRFHAWFGRMSLHRLYWNARYQSAPEENEPSEAVRRFAETLPRHARVLEIACGTGADARFLAAQGHDVTAFDYSWVAIEQAQRGGESKVDFRVANLYDNRQMLKLIAELRSEEQPIYVFMHHAIDGVTNSARINAAMMCKHLLREGSFALMTSFASPGRGFDMERPETWHIPVHDIHKTAGEFGLAARIERVETVTGGDGKRVVTDAVIRQRVEK